MRYRENRMRKMSTRAVLQQLLLAGILLAALLVKHQLETSAPADKRLYEHSTPEGW